MTFSNLAVESGAQCWAILLELVEYSTARSWKRKLFFHKTKEKFFYIIIIQLSIGQLHKIEDMKIF
jgi:hypothetical protein